MTAITLPPLPAGGPPDFHLLAKPSGATCNIDCTYCFFLSKEALYPNEVISSAFILYGMEALVAGQIADFIKYPPRQKPASFNLY